MHKRCYCRSCADRDLLRFWRIIDRNWTPYDRARKAHWLPPVPEWEGEPAELVLERDDGA